VVYIRDSRQDAKVPRIDFLRRLLPCVKLFQIQQVTDYYGADWSSDKARVSGLHFAPDTLEDADHPLPTRRVKG
jgi:hypothetical protein